MKPPLRIYGKKSNCIQISALMLMTGLTVLLAGANALAEPRIVLEQVVAGLQYPVDINHAGDGTGRLFVVEQAGRIKIIEDGNLKSTPFLDISSRVQCCGEQGLLGVAFHPEYKTNGYFYVNYTGKQRAGVPDTGDTVIARYEVSSEDADRADSSSEAIIMTISQPFGNHNAGKLLFSPNDGYLYIPLGDGGSGGDPGNRSQNPLTLLGKVLRIDVDSAFPYDIPPDNPFVDAPNTLDEIWALGLRNPWRFSFDRLTGDMYIGDVGQRGWEEIDYQAADSAGGINYGWRCREGAHNYNFSGNCENLDLTDPIAEYVRDPGNSVTGGFVYRGAKFLALYGQYFYADYATGRVWTIFQTGTNSWSMPTLEDTTGLQISTFGEDESGELYLAQRSSNNGIIYQIVDVCEGDLDNDGDVDGIDVGGDQLKLLAEDFGRTDCPN